MSNSFYREGTETFETLSEDNKDLAKSILNHTIEQGGVFSGVDFSVDPSSIETDCEGGVPEVWHFKSTPEGFAIYDKLPGGCLLLPGDVCIDSCLSSDDFAALHDSCVDTSTIQVEYPEEDYQNFTPRIASSGILDNYCEPENEFSYSDFATVEEILTLHNPIMVIRDEGTWVRIPIPFERNIDTPDVTPRPTAPCRIEGVEISHGTTRKLWAKKNPNPSECKTRGEAEPRESTHVTCNDGKLISTGDRDQELSDGDLANYSLRYEPCDCNSPAGVMAHGTTRMFYTKSDSYDCGQAGCPQAERRCNDKTLDGNGGAIHVACTNHTDRCLNNLIKQASNPGACAAIMEAAVLDAGGDNLCTVVAKQFYGDKALAKIVAGGTKCEIRSTVETETFTTRNSKGDYKNVDAVAEGGSVVHRGFWYDGKYKDQLKSRTDHGSCVALENMVGGPGSMRLTDDSGDALKNGRVIEGYRDEAYRSMTLEQMAQKFADWKLDINKVANITKKGTGSTWIDGDGRTKSRWAREDSATLNVMKSDRTKKAWGFDFVGCSSGCFDLKFISFNSPIMISLNGLMPKGVIDARFSYDGKTVVDTKWPIFDASEPIGFLAYDFNGNGTIDDGTELFGEYTGGERFQHGYDALSYFFDGNGDGVVSGTELEGLMMWKDLDGDGKGSADELSSLVSYGITELDAGRHTDDKARLDLEGGHASPVSLERGVVWTDEKGTELFGASFDVWYLKKED